MVNKELTVRAGLEPTVVNLDTIPMAERETALLPVGKYQLTFDGQFYEITAGLPERMKGKRWGIHPNIVARLAA